MPTNLVDEVRKAMKQVRCNPGGNICRGPAPVSPIQNWQMGRVGVRRNTPWFGTIGGPPFESRGRSCDCPEDIPKARNAESRNPQ